MWSSLDCMQLYRMREVTLNVCLHANTDRTFSLHMPNACYYDDCFTAILVVGRCPLLSTPSCSVKILTTSLAVPFQRFDWGSKFYKTLSCRRWTHFVQIGQGVAEIWPFSIFQDNGRPPSWICYTPVWINHKVYLMVSVTVQNLV